MQWRAVLCAVLVLAVSAAHAETYVVKAGDITLDKPLLNGDTFDLGQVEQSEKNRLSVSITAPTITEGGVQFQGSIAELVTTKLVIIGMYDAKVTDATISLGGYIPYNTAITISRVTATMTSAKPVFALSSLHLSKESSLTIEGVTAQWDDASHKAWVVNIMQDSETLTIKQNSGLYVLKVAAQKAAGVVGAGDKSSVDVSESSSFAVDYVSCSECTDAIVSLPSHAAASASSMVRISNIASNNRPVLRMPGGAEITDKSLMVISHISTNTGNLFDASASTITVSGGSVMTYRDLRAPSTGLTAALPSTVADDSVVYGRECVIGGSTLATTEDYASKQLNVGTIVAADGRTSGTQTCANAHCVPTHYSPPSKPADPCLCMCTGSYASPSCATATDPLTAYFTLNDDKVVCTTPGCESCPTDPAKCSVCIKGYDMQEDSTCKKHEQPTTTTTTKKPDPDPSSGSKPGPGPKPDPKPHPLPAHDCSPHCVKCQTASGTDMTPVCVQCEKGYVLQGKATCVKQYSGAYAMTALPSAVGALLISVALGCVA